MIWRSLEVLSRRIETSVWTVALFLCCFCRICPLFLDHRPLAFQGQRPYLSVYICCTPGSGTVLEMHGLALFHLVGPQWSRWSLSPTIQTWEAQVGPSLAGKSLVLSEVFSKRVECFMRKETKRIMANPWAELLWSHPNEGETIIYWAGSHGLDAGEGGFCSSFLNSAFNDVTL